MPKNKKTIIILCAVTNLIIILIMIFFTFIFTSQNISSYQNRNIISAQNATSSISDALKLYFDQQRRNILNRKAYILTNSMSFDETVRFLCESGKSNTTTYQLVNCTDYSFTACAPDGTISDNKYSRSYSDNIYRLCDDAKNGLIDDSIFNATASFTNPVNGTKSIALYTGINFTDSAGKSENYLLLGVDRTTDLVGTGLPKPPFDNADSAMTDANGDYIANGNSFKSKNIFEFFRIYNNLNYPEADKIHNTVLENLSGSRSFKNSRGNTCLYSYCKISGTNNWYCFTCIPQNSFVDSNVKYQLVVVIILSLLIITLFDGGIIVLLNRRLKNTLDNESVLREEAEKANRSKSEFLSRMSHEIRTPLNAIIGYNLLARDSLKEITSRSDAVTQKALKIEDCLTKSDISSKHLLSVINDVLDMSSIESGKIEYNSELFDFKNLISTLKIMFTALANDKEISFEVIIRNELAEQIYGDPIRIKQILTNLIGNAIKFTQENGTVSLIIDQTKKDDENIDITFIIKDNGIGMNEEFLNRIWLPFEQADSSIVRKYGGSGLGLAITKKLVDIAGGSITVESCSKKGSTFTVILPSKISVCPMLTDNEKISSYKQPFDFSGTRVLLAEDNQMNLEIAKAILEKKNISVDHASNGKECLDKFITSKAGTYNAVLMDIQMPVMDGYEATKKIRSSGHPEAVSIPIIAMTADAFTENVKMAFECGMNDHIAKPINIDQLFSSLEKNMTR